jgi:predicted ATP-grasp superfamily ATP-dependent carboligase
LVNGDFGGYSKGIVDIPGQNQRDGKNPPVVSICGISVESVVNIIKKNVYEQKNLNLKNKNHEKK